MTQRVLFIEPEKCNGCMDCMKACAVAKSGESDPYLSRIRVHTIGAGSYLPVACQQCADAPCLSACPKEAIYRDDETGRVVTDYNRCVGCKMCVFACPFGAMGFDEGRSRTFKCDLCGGTPACVPVCEPLALSYIDAAVLHYRRQRSAARKTAATGGR